MKNVKKIIAILMAMVMIVCMAACNKDVQDPTEPDVTVAPTDAVTEPATEPEVPVTEPVIKKSDLVDTTDRLVKLFDVCPTEFPVVTWEIDLNDADALKSFTGLDSSVGIVEVSVTEPAMSSQAYSVVLVKIAEGTDAEAILAAMEEGINPRKWVCVEADSIESVIVEDYILFAMTDSALKDAKEIVDAFVSLMNEGAAVEGETPISEEVPSEDEAPVADAPAVENTEATAEG